jgi:NADH-quinone oxidoreductase subunit B
MNVAGTVTKRWRRRLFVYKNQMSKPNKEIAMGACAISGGPFKQGSNVLKVIDMYIPVVYMCRVSTKPRHC